ncbi:unnamed protein product [Nesidiocoris tenuis]|uniref:Reverse transcriptase domain-containing protein n=1 Tax=Nesidiocoris tenuis TaxID=355587 RepID=A0A6H5GTC9_9HEMI|nr:unnamed protein product [Nesidiocoris tenuis]CAB0006185.1 unnamed protein product [Nesidiocoris tenuis]
MKNLSFLRKQVKNNLQPEFSYGIGQSPDETLNAGSFPVKWKDSYVTPIFKSGCKTLVSNYRAVCTISSIPKSFEKLVVGRLSPIFVNVIAPEQHGFIKGRSTTTNLVEFTDFVFSGFDSGEQVDVVSVDFAKAFDRVSHKHITALLQSMGVYGLILSWIESYLSDRRQFVRFKNVVSEPYRASSGIPQGSNIGPLLFVIMINSVTSIPRPEGVELLMFADDLKIFGVVSSEDDYMGIQTFLDSLQGWCLANCLHLNPAKCTAASFSRSSRLLSFPYRIGGGVLDRPASIRDLGVFMDAKLTFSHHIDAIVSKALRALGFLKRCTRDFTSMEAIVLLYKSLVRPILEYSSVVWSPYYQVHKERLERVQRRFLRYLNFKMHIPLEELDIVELAARSGLRDLEVRQTMFRIISRSIKSYTVIKPYVNVDVTLREIDYFKEIVNRRKLDVDMDEIAFFYDNLKRLAEVNSRLEAARASISGDIERLGPDGNEDEKRRLVMLAKTAREDHKHVKSSLHDMEQSLIRLMLRVPNVLHPETADHDVISYCSEIPSNSNGCHLEIGKKLGLLDYRSPAAYFLKNEAAEFELESTADLVRTLKSEGYVGFANPDFVREIVLDVCSEANVRSMPLKKFDDDQDVHFVTGGA